MTLVIEPQVLANLEDKIFGGLSPSEKGERPLRFTNAVKEGTDLSQVYPQFQIWLLIDPDHGVIRFAETDEQRKIIKDCADLFVNWPNVNGENADFAVDAAYSAGIAAYAASSAAANVADHSASASASSALAAADAADAARAAAAARAVNVAYCAALAAARSGDAADYAGYSAAAAARAADYAARAAAGPVHDARKSHYTTMADKMIELIKAAPCH